MQTAAPKPQSLFSKRSPINAESRPRTRSRPRNYERGTLEGLTLILTYLRTHGVRSLKVGRIIRGLGLEESHGLRTRLGWGLGKLVQEEYLVRWGSGRKANYVPTYSLLVFLEEHPCLSGCYTGLNTCNLYGTEGCPFGQGLGGGSRGADG